MKSKVNGFLAILLFLGALGHFVGTLQFYRVGSDVFAWSLSGTFLAAILAALNWRPAPGQTLLLAFGNLSWLVVVGFFALSIQSFFDPRVLMHAVAAGGLLVCRLFDLKSRA